MVFHIRVGWCVLNGSVRVLLMGYMVCGPFICVLDEKTGSWRLFRDGVDALLGVDPL